MTYCPDCGTRKRIAKINKKTGLQEVNVVQTERGAVALRLWFCWKCGAVIEDSMPVIPVSLRRQSVLYVDIESSLSEYYSYGRKVQSKYLDPADLISEYFTISWAACYVGTSKVFGGVVTLQQALDKTDKHILQPLADLMRSADIIAGHNVDGFDLKKINTRLLLNGIEPVMGADGKPKKTIDTLKIARSRFDFDGGNSLDHLCKRFGINGKDHISKDDWRAVMRGDQKTLDKVYKYNRGDVTNGIKLYEILQPYSGKPEHYGAV
jgi:hypothetical protein